jgi:hypothetical protein
MSKDITIFVCGNSISSAQRDQYGELPSSVERTLHEADVAFDIHAVDGKVVIDVHKNRLNCGLTINHHERST